MVNVEKVKNYITTYPIRCLCIIGIVVLLIGGLCYFFGQPGDSDANLDRVSDAKQQLNDASEQLDAATATNREAQSTIAKSILLNQSIRDSINQSAKSNERTGAAITEAQSVVRDANATAKQSANIISDSQRILNTARTRSTPRAGGHK